MKDIPEGFFTIQVEELIMVLQINHSVLEFSDRDITQYRNHT